MTTTVSREVFWSTLTDEVADTGDYLAIMLGEQRLEEAAQINDSDLNELFEDLLPNLAGLEVLELASGSGRISGELAKRCKHVTCTDLIKGLVEENERTNGSQYSNMTFATLDASNLDYPPNSFDVVFFTYLLVYLSDAEMKSIAKKLIRMVRNGGYLFFRESHFKCLCTRSVNGNPGIYRSLKDYHDVFRNCHSIGNYNNTMQFFDLVHCTNSRTYVKMRNLPTVFNYLLKKREIPMASIDMELVMISQYKQRWPEETVTEEMAAVYDQIVGRGFTTPGGVDGAKELLLDSRLDLTVANFSCLGVGYGLGGIMTYLIKEFNIDITGIDLSLNGCQESVKMLQELHVNKGLLKLADPSTVKFKKNSFNAILLLETLEHFPNKAMLLSLSKQWLKLCGKIIITTCCYDNLLSEPQQVTAGNGVHTVSQQEIFELLYAEFSEVAMEDYTAQRIKYLQSDLEKLYNNTVIPFGMKQMLMEQWKVKLEALQNNRLHYVIFTIS